MVSTHVVLTFVTFLCCFVLTPGSTPTGQPTTTEVETERERSGLPSAIRDSQRADNELKSAWSSSIR